MNDIYFFLSSTDSANIYPQNNPYAFTVQLPEIVQLSDNWSCCLVYFLCHLREDTSSIYVLCDAISDSYVKDTKLPVLQYIHSKTQDSLIFEICNGSEIELKVNKTALHTISIHIRDADTFKPISGDSESTITKCILRLRKL